VHQGLLKPLDLDFFTGFGLK